ncbi:MAG TPA: DNA polymerase III subunit delta' [Marinobacter sp.]|nr:DNA polymerase III subunit delta' [Marinobacter sp.]
MTNLSDTMPWLDEPWRSVQQRLAAQRLPHALLLVGERGVGKRALAEAAAGLLVCDRPQSSAAGLPLACGQCKQCDLIAGESHPDIRRYRPEKSRMVKVDQVRALSAFAVASPQVARHKVAIVDRADQLNINAANALLKTLEEPLADVTLLLLQEHGRPVLPTIRSRCQSLVLPLPDEPMARNWLASAAQALPEAERPGPDVLAKALTMTGNAPLLALDYAMGDFITLRDEALAAFRQFMKGKLAIGDTAKAFKALGLEDTLWLFEAWAADLARCCAGGAARDPDAAEMMNYLARANPPWVAHDLMDRVRESREASVYNASPELEASQLLMAWQSLMPRKRVSG